jgi:membrane associated rhomboid family serine protease
VIRRSAATLTIATVTAVVGALQLRHVEVLTWLQRDPAQLRAGQWWRLVTPLLVQPAGWGQYGFNLVGVVLVGLGVERRYRALRTLACYLGAGIAGVGVALLWAPHERGGGSSDAVAGLVGALTVAYWVDRRPPGRIAVGYAVFFVVYLTVLDALGVTASVVAGGATAALVGIALRAGRIGVVRQVTMLVVLFGAAATSLLWDPHGVGLLAGLLLGSALLPRIPQRPPGPGIPSRASAPGMPARSPTLASRPPVGPGTRPPAPR